MSGNGSSINQTRICVEKLLPGHNAHMNNLKQQSNSHDHFSKLRAAFYTSKLWPKGSNIKIGFVGTADVPRTSLTSIQNKRGYGGRALKVDPLQLLVDKLPIMDAIKKIVKERIIPIVNLNISFVTDPTTANIRISFNPNGGAWSLIGTDCLDKSNDGKPTMNFGWFDVATTMHEFGHALGMVHEDYKLTSENYNIDLIKI